MIEPCKTDCARKLNMPELPILHRRPLHKLEGECGTDKRTESEACEHIDENLDHASGLPNELQNTDGEHGSKIASTESDLMLSSTKFKTEIADNVIIQTVQHNWYTQSIICSIVVFLLSLLVYHLYPYLLVYLQYHISPTQIYSNNELSHIKKLIRDIESTFHNQREDTWLSIGSSIMSVNTPIEPRQPSILLFISEDRNIEVRNCLITKVVNGIGVYKAQSSQPSPIPIYAETVTSETLSEDLHGRLRRGEVAYVHNIDLMDHASAMVLHGLCNNNDAPYLRGIFVFSAQTRDTNIIISANSKPSEVAYKLLNASWYNINIDARASVISRVTGEPILVLPEDNLKC